MTQWRHNHDSSAETSAVHLRPIPPKDSDGGGWVKGDRVELINGEIFERAAIGSKHSTQVNRLNRLFSKRLITEGMDEEILISVQNPVELGPKSEPDVALLKDSEERYKLRHPQPADVLLIIEVSDSTVEFDRDVKGPLYASSGIQEYWLINLQVGVIEVHRHRDPSNSQILIHR